MYHYYTFVYHTILCFSFFLPLSIHKISFIIYQSIRIRSLAKIILHILVHSSHQFRKLRIRSREKSGRCIEFNDSAVAHDENAIARDDRLQSMSDRKHGAICEFVLQSILHCRFGFRIDSGCCFV